MRDPSCSKGRNVHDWLLYVIVISRELQLWEETAPYAMCHIIHYFLTSETSTLLWTTNFGFRVRESYLTKKPLPALMSLSFNKPSSAVQYSDRLPLVQSVVGHISSLLAHLRLQWTNAAKATVLQEKAVRCIFGKVTAFQTLKVMMISWFWPNNLFAVIWINLWCQWMTFSCTAAADILWVANTILSCNSIALLSNWMQSKISRSRSRSSSSRGLMRYKPRRVRKYIRKHVRPFFSLTAQEEPCNEIGIILTTDIL